VLFIGMFLEADFIKRAFTKSGVRLGPFARAVLPLARNNWRGHTVPLSLPP
jgi:hypothetical protein